MRKIVVACTLGLAAAAPGAWAADIHVMISAGFFAAYSDALPEFQRRTGHHVITVRGPSLGDSPEAIPARLGRGEPADVAILDGASADELATRGFVRPETKVVFARSLIGMVVRTGEPKPDISTVEAFKRALLDAKSIAYSDSGSGTYLSTTLFKKLGIADQVLPKSRKVRGPPSGEPVAAVIARGDAQLGFQQVSELIHTEGVSFVDAIPAELQPGFTFAGVITKNAAEPGPGGELIRYLASREVSALIARQGLDPIAPPQLPPPDDAAATQKAMRDRFPAGSPLEEAVAALESDGFNCAAQDKEAFEKLARDTYVLCERQVPYGFMVAKRWQLALVRDGGKVKTIQASYGLVAR